MKRIMTIFLCAMLICSTAGCGMTSTDESRNDTDNSAASEGTAVQDSAAEPDMEDRAAAENDAQMSIDTGGGNILIAYFSVPEDVDISGVDAVAGASIVVRDGEKLGNTEYVAKVIQETIGGDLFRIETKEPYPLDHEPLVDLAAEEQDAALRPELAASVENFGQYEYIFLGFAGGIIGLNQEKPINQGFALV